MGYEEIREEWERRYPHSKSQYLAWCYLFDKNPCLAWGGDGDNLNYMDWINGLIANSTYELDNHDFWYEAVSRKEIYEEVH